MNFSTPIVIGLEIHAELNTQTKLFCSCPTTGSDAPNTRTCPTCLGMPGAKPVLNKQVLDHGLKICLGLKSKIADKLVFSRKSYFYPDLAKNYQVTQFELPLGEGGELTLESGKNVRMKRAHIEEDPASLVHPAGVQNSTYVLVDYNRSGNPLMEMVTEPDMESPDQARDFMNQLITLLDYLNVFDQNEGVIKADANISIKESNYTRVEVKNITGFKEIERALKYEVQRQKTEVQNGAQILCETRGWDSEKGMTYSLRLKESEDDYGYIIDPDLVPISITEERIDHVREIMPELAADKLKKLQEADVEETTAKVISKDKHLAAMYDDVAAKIDPQLASKWIRRELSKVLNYQKKSLEESGITSDHMISLLSLLAEKKITDKTGQKLIEKLSESVFNVDEYVKQENLLVIQDDSLIDTAVQEAIAENAQAVDQYKNGEEKALNFIIGQVMRKTRGKAPPATVKEKVLAQLDE